MGTSGGFRKSAPGENAESRGFPVRLQHGPNSAVPGPGGVLKTTQGMISRGCQSEYTRRHTTLLSVDPRTSEAVAVDVRIIHSPPGEVLQAVDLRAGFSVQACVIHGVFTRGSSAVRPLDQ